MLSKQPIGRGQRYRDAHMSAFGRSGSAWIVEVVRTGADGIEYALLFGAIDHTERKTLSTAILGDRRRFIRVEE